MKYVMYRRLSVEDKSRKQHGFDSQLSDIKDFLNKQDSYEVIGDFKEFVSGAAKDKPELNKALELCKSTGATLVISKLDRLSRKVSQIAVLMESNVDLKVAMMPNASTFELHIYASLAQQEREMIRDRVRKGLKVVKNQTPEKLQKGIGSKWRESYEANKHNHKKSRTQYVKSDNTLPTVEKVNNVVKLFNNDLTLKALADKLNSNGILTPTNKPWSEANLSRFAKRYDIVLTDKRKVARV